MAFNKTLISKWLTWYTADHLYLRGVSFEWGIADEHGEQWFSDTKDNVCKIATGLLNDGFDAVIDLRSSVERTNGIILMINRIRIEPDDEAKMRGTIARAEKEKSNFPQTRDFQRQKVYDWERIYITDYDISPLNDEEIRELLDELVEVFGTSPVTFVVQASRSRSSQYFGWKNEMRLAEGWGRRKDIILHEFAHHVDRSIVAHGEIFVGVVMDLYEMYLDQDRDEMRKNLDKMKIKYNEEWNRVGI